MTVGDPGDAFHVSEERVIGAPCEGCGAHSRVLATVTPAGSEFFAVLVSTESVARSRENLLRRLQALAPNSEKGPLPAAALTWYTREHLNPSERAKITGATLGSPATTFSDLPPACPQCQLAVHAHFVAPPPGGPSFTASPVSSGRAGVTGNVLTDSQGARHLRLADLQGNARGSFREECTAIFEQAHDALDENGFVPGDVLRTWIYLRDIQSDYDALNEVRRDAFKRWGLSVYPASTGVGGSPKSNDARCALSLYAVSGLEDASVQPLCAGSFNEAHEYGSYFARALQVELGGRRTILVSGTAAIGRGGETIAVGDLDAQVAYTLVNIDGLLNAAAAGLEDTVSAISYLKPGQDARRYRELVSRKLSTPIPHLVVAAELCRDELLCEMELIACTQRPKR